MGGRQLKALLAQGRSGWANGTIASRDRKVFLFDKYRMISKLGRKEFKSI